MLMLSCGRASRGTTAHLTTTGNALATSSGPHAHERLALSSVPEQRQARELEPREYRPPTTAVPDSDAAPRRRADISDDGGDGVRRVSTARVVVGIMIGTPGTVHGTGWHTAPGPAATTRGPCSESSQPHASPPFRRLLTFISLRGTMAPHYTIIVCVGRAPARAAEEGAVNRVSVTPLARADLRARWARRAR